MSGTTSSGCTGSYGQRTRSARGRSTRRQRSFEHRGAEREQPVQALHGDVSLSNLFRTGNGLLWSDFEDTFRGPVHWDVAGYVMSLRDRGADSEFVARVLDDYGWPDERRLVPFMKAHDLHGEIWRLYDVQRRRL
jgi:hypothetical protein